MAPPTLKHLESDPASQGAISAPARTEGAGLRAGLEAQVLIFFTVHKSWSGQESPPQVSQSRQLGKVVCTNEGPQPLLDGTQAPPRHAHQPRAHRVSIRKQMGQLEPGDIMMKQLLPKFLPPTQLLLPGKSWRLRPGEGGDSSSANPNLASVTHQHHDPKGVGTGNGHLASAFPLGGGASCGSGSDPAWPDCPWQADGEYTKWSCH